MVCSVRSEEKQIQCNKKRYSCKDSVIQEPYKNV